ncbi:MAG: ComEC/Rec2 family competence protein [Verrucomicrobiota bacterium]
MKRPLLPVALCYVGGLLLAYAVPLSLLFLFTLSFGLLLIALLFAKARNFLLWPLLVLVGWTNLTRHTTSLSPHDLRILAGNEPTLATLRGRLAETPSLRLHERNGKEFARTRVPFDVTALATNGHWQPAVGCVMISTKGELPAEFFGGRDAEISGVLTPPPGPIAAGLFDYRTYLARQGIYYQLKSEFPRDWHTVDSQTNAPFADRFLAWAQRTLSRGLPEKDEPLRLLWAMTLGWKTALTGEVNESFMKSGTMHIFAVSGLHIALIAGILVSLLRVARVPRAWCGAFVIPLIWFYTGATGWQSSAIRSTIMMTIVIGGWSLRRPSDLLNSLAAAALIILLWQPQQLFQASFQLSFFVVLSIALFMPPLEKLRDRWLAIDPMLAPEVIPKWKHFLRAVARIVLTSFVTSLAAWFGSLPLTAYYFHIFSPITLLANLIIVPMSSAALACNLGSLLCGDWLPWLTELFNHSAWLWMLLMVKISHWSTEIPGAYAFVTAPSAFTFIIYYGLLIGFMSGWLWQKERRPRTLAALALIGIFYTGQWFVTRKNMELTILPLDGGQAEYFNAAGKSQDWLMDCGNTNSVELIMRPFLRAQGVNQLPRLMLTHGDLKHVGGAEELAAEFRCHDIFASSFRFRSVAYRRLFTDLQREPYHITTLHRGDEATPWRILHPTAADESAQADDGALVRQAELHGVKILLLSDLGRMGQNLLLDRETNNLHSDIVVTGLPTQGEALCEALLDAIQPRVIVIADSELPATARASLKLKERLERRKVLVLSTREVGAVSILFHPKHCEISTAIGQKFKLVNLPAMTTPPANEFDSDER